MPWNGSGSFSSIYSWVADANAGIDINANRMDTQEADYTSTGFGNCITRDGQGVPSANLPMAGFKHTGAAVGVAATDYATMGQLQAASTNWVAAGGTSDAITATYAPAVTSLTDGMVLYFRATAANLTTTPTFAPNGLTAHTITKNGGQALAIGDIFGSLNEVGVRYNLANTRWELLNPPDVPIGGMVPFFGGTVPSGFALPTGQNLAAATYPAANAVLGTTYGAPGGGNFTMPDLRGRTGVHIDSGATRLSGVATIGATTGQQNKAILQANLPSVNFINSGIAIDNGNHNHVLSPQTAAVNTTYSATNSGGGVTTFIALNGPSSTNNSGSITSVTAQGTSASGGSGTALATVQPTMAVNMMMRIA